MKETKCVGQNLPGHRLSRERKPDNHEPVPYHHHVVNLNHLVRASDCGAGRGQVEMNLQSKTTYGDPLWICFRISIDMGAMREQDPLERQGNIVPSLLIVERRSHARCETAWVTPVPLLTRDPPFPRNTRLAAGCSDRTHH